MFTYDFRGSTWTGDTFRDVILTDVTLTEDEFCWPQNVSNTKNIFNFDICHFDLDLSF